MPDFSSAFPADIAAPLVVFGRLVAAMVLGGIVAQVYRRSRAEPASSFTVTLVLLAILNFYCEQVIGETLPAPSASSARCPSSGSGPS